MKLIPYIVIAIALTLLVYYSHQAYNCGKNGGVYVRTFTGMECIKR